MNRLPRKTAHIVMDISTSSKSKNLHFFNDVVRASNVLQDRAANQIIHD